MFNDIGKKIKKLAEVIAWIGIIGYLLCGVVFAFNSSFLLGMLVAIMGCLSSYIGCFFMYGFGEIIEKITKIEENTRKKRASEENSRYRNPNDSNTKDSLVIKNDVVRRMVEQGTIKC